MPRIKRPKILEEAMEAMEKDVPRPKKMVTKVAVVRIQPYTLRTHSSSNGSDVKKDEEAHVKIEVDPSELATQPLRTNSPEASDHSDSSSLYLIQDDREVSDNELDSDDSSDNSGKTWLEVLSSSDEEPDEEFDNEGSVGITNELPPGPPQIQKARVARAPIKNARPIQKSLSEPQPANVPKMIDAACQTDHCCNGPPKIMKNATTMTLPLPLAASQVTNRSRKDQANGNKNADSKQQKVENSRKTRSRSVAKVVPQVPEIKKSEPVSFQCRKGTVAYGLQEGVGRSKRTFKRVTDLFSDVRYYYSMSGPGYEDWKKRYQEEDGKIYLGEGIYIDAFRWWCIKALKRPACFLKDLAIEIWTEDELANRSFEPESINNLIPGKAPPQLVEPNLLRLIMSVYYEHLCDDTTMDEAERTKHVLKTTSELSSKMCSLRSQKCREASAQAGK